MRSTATTRQDDLDRRASLASNWAKTIFTRLMERIEHGRLTIEDGGEVMVFGADGDLAARVTVLDQRFYAKMLLGGSVGAGEAYVDQFWTVDDLAALIRIFTRNVEALNRFESRYKVLLQPLHLLRHRLNRNSRSGAKRNIISHYDLGNDMYRSFLDSRMMYSSAVYPAADSDLEEASFHKLDLICRKLALAPGDEVIEIGSGWCGFAIHAATHYGCRVTTTTISDAQYEEGSKRIEAAGLEDRITLLKQDYRELTGTFDKLVSIEMIEAVGHRYHPRFFEVCSNLLADDGLMLLQAITIRDQVYDQYLKSVDFIQRHIFPGGCLLSNHRIIAMIDEKTDMIVRQLEDFGLDYARTLQDWRERFNRAFVDLRKLGYDDRFKRLWNFYLAYCEGGFKERAISVVQLVAAKPGCREEVTA